MIETVVTDVGRSGDRGGRSDAMFDPVSEADAGSTPPTLPAPHANVFLWHAEILLEVGMSGLNSTLAQGTAGVADQRPACVEQ